MILYKMNKEDTKEVQTWVDYIKDSMVAIFKTDKVISAHALIFAKNAHLKKHGSTMKEGAFQITNKNIEDMPDEGFGFMHVPMEPMMKGDVEKDMAANILENLVIDTKAYAYAFISEAYSTKGEPGDDMKDKDGNYIRPSDLPDDQRREIIMMMIETRDWIELETYEIIREDKEPWLYKLDDQRWDSREGKNGASQEGRFSGFLYKDREPFTEFKSKNKKLFDDIASRTNMSHKERDAFLSRILENPDLLNPYIKEKITNDPKKIKVVRHDLIEVVKEIIKEINKIKHK